MKMLPIALRCCLIVAASALVARAADAINQLTPEEAAGGWRLLWDGQTTHGWRSARGPDFPATARRHRHEQPGLTTSRRSGGIEGTEIAYLCDVEDGALAKGIEEGRGHRARLAAEGRQGLPAGCWTTSPSTRSRSRSPTTGTRRWRSWRWPPASMCTSRSRAARIRTRASCS
jgi:hypothetical protein